MTSTPVRCIILGSFFASKIVILNGGHSLVSRKVHVWAFSVREFSVLNASNVQKALKNLHDRQARQPQKVFSDVAALGPSIPSLFRNLE